MKAGKEAENKKDKEVLKAGKEAEKK